MKFYVTGRSTNYPVVQKMFEEIKSKGHDIVNEYADLSSHNPS